MAQGFCPSLLKHIVEIAGDNAPGRKLNVAGMLAMTFCCQNSSVSPINDQFQAGHYRTLTIKYRKRPTVSDTQTEENCDINTQPGYLEWTVPALSYRSISFHISDDQIQQYCVDASRMETIGAPPTQVMAEVYDLIVEHANTLLAGINQDLVTLQATEFGVNVVDGTSAGTFLNISRDGDKLILDDGIVKLMQDLQENEICGEPCIVGGGLFAAYQKAHAVACCNSAGVDLGRVGLPRFFFDKDTQTIWGQNSIGVFAPGSVKFVGRNRFVGSFAGQKPGSSIFTTLPLPVNEFGCADDCLRDLVLDMQLKYIDCPTTIDVGGAPQTVDRGWQVILSKYYTLWTQPDNAFDSGDPLEGTNGTLKYFVSNTNYDGGAYAYPGA
jgi:hypothetical protein